MMSNRKILTAAVALAVSCTPIYTYAVPAQAGLEACAEAMVERLAENQGAPMSFKLDSDSEAGGSRMTGSEIIHLDARNPGSEEIVARVDCVVTKTARVRRLIDLPLDAEDAKTRATTYNY